MANEFSKEENKMVAAHHPFCMPTDLTENLEQVESLGRRLRLTNEEIKDVLDLLREAPRFKTLKNMPKSELRKFLALPYFPAIQTVYK